MSKRKAEDVVAYIENVSPQKRNKSFNVRLQTENASVKAICFDMTKREQIVNARLSGEAVKFNRIINQMDDSKVNHFADYVINSSTTMKDVDAESVTFERKEKEEVYVSLEDATTLKIGSLVSVKGKVTMKNTRERDVLVGRRTVKVLNNALLLNNSGSITLTSGSHLLHKMFQSVQTIFTFIICW
jgi:hypothetical protein